jgi:hypothetical protein
MMISFKKFISLKEQNTVGYHNDGPGSGFVQTGGSYLSTDQTGSEQDPSKAMLGHAQWLPGTDMTAIPTVTKSSRISFIEKNKNPIKVLLQDGTRLNFSWDQFKRIKGDVPEKGKIMTVIFQRNPSAGKDESSQILSCQCH